MKKTNQQIEREDNAKRRDTQRTLGLPKSAKKRRRETLAFVEQHAAPEQLEWLDEKLSQLVSMAQTVRIRLWADKELVTLIDRGAKLCGTSRAGFIRQPIEDALPKIEAAGR